MSARLLLAALPPALVLALALALLAGCPGSLEDPGRFEAGVGGAAVCPDIPTLFTQSCAISGCHTATSPAGALDLASADVFTRLSGMKASGGPGVLIDPSSPADSVLYTKLTATPPFLSRMPLTGGALDPATVSCVLAWIEAGGQSTGD